ncbi:TetR/AcrR family transcriptional regulator [Halopseudomonas laoshanensis]|uniref:TetR/AcrR family transcriptional regulator n=2 Tax=Halopseudomonas laoshanensis TaxID=2268758 RepID=A0A7V7KVY3_9GAMM|nr:TetR/AcrR family transcriptional regulator [Halopseudomonas laoshanensis]
MLIDSITLLCKVKYNRSMNESQSNILKAASELFLQGGTAALSVRAIAARAGVSTIGIYSHFQGKQGILDALYIEGFSAVIDALAVDDLTADPRERVLLASRRYLDTAETFEPHYGLIFGKLDDSYQPSAEARTLAAAGFERLTEVVGGLLTADAPASARRNVALQVWALIHGFVGLKNHAVGELVDMRCWKERAMEAVEILVDGIIKRVEGQGAV